MARSIGRGRCDAAISRFPVFGHNVDDRYFEIMKSWDVASI